VRDHILLYLNGRPVTVGGDDAFLTLSEWLRRRQQLPGTKVVCAEGDCGSCAVLIGRPTADAGEMAYAAVTSCIQLIFQLDGAHVVTVEGLKEGRKLNPIQQSLVACQGTQCGFCTPGFVVSLYDLMHNGGCTNPHEIRRGLVGNLCRCTGYDSIVRAACAVDRPALKSLDVLYPPEPLVQQLAAAAKEGVRIDTPQRQLFKPTTVDEACEFRQQHPGCSVIAGATDLGVVHNKRTRPITQALVIGHLGELRGVRSSASAIAIGAAESLSALEREANRVLPELGAYMAWFGSPLIKNAGTLGGNLVTGSPIGDTAPPLMALDATVHLVGVGGRRRTVPVNAFYTGYRTTVLAADELVASVEIPIPQPTDRFKLYKISRRKDLDISTFSAAVWIRLSGNLIKEARLAFGGVAPVVLRMRRTEAALVGQAASLATFQAAGEIAGSEVTPISDVRGSAGYRRALARNILTRFWHEVFGQGAPGTSGHDPRHDDGTNNGNGTATPPAANRIESIAAT
jgi:xanthine dehydrogenase small subunit